MLCAKCGYKFATGAVCKKCGSPLLSKTEGENQEGINEHPLDTSTQEQNTVPVTTEISQNAPVAGGDNYNLDVEIPNDFRFSDDQDEEDINDNPIENASIPVRHTKTKTRVTKKKNKKRIQKRILFFVTRILIAIIIAYVVYLIIDKFIAPNFFVFGI